MEKDEWWTEKRENDLTRDLTRIIADMHKHSAQLDHDKEIVKSKPNKTKE